MRYTKPQITANLKASTHINGVNPALQKGATPALDNFNPNQSTQIPAYESDE